MQQDLSHILFLDIETVPITYRYDSLDPEIRELWDEKMFYQHQQSGASYEELYSKAGVLAEFAKVVCICSGFIHMEYGVPHFRMKTFAGHDEATLLYDFFKMLDDKFGNYALCAHNGKEFDFPFMARRMLVNGVKIPKHLNTAGKKPWEVNHLDTMELWKFGDRKHFTSLKLLAHLFGLPTPKDDISGKDVARVYYEEDNLDRIITYCQKDVITLANLMLRWNQQNTINESHISFV